MTTRPHEPVQTAIARHPGPSTVYRPRPGTHSSSFELVLVGRAGPISPSHRVPRSTLSQYRASSLRVGATRSRIARTDMMHASMPAICAA